MNLDFRYEPKTTPSILATISDCLKLVLEKSFDDTRRRNSILLSSNSLANRFILDRWGIRPSQRKRFKNLFSIVRKECRGLFANYLAREQIEWSKGDERCTFGVFRFDEIRGNLILGFVKIHKEDWRISIKKYD